MRFFRKKHLEPPTVSAADLTQVGRDELRNSFYRSLDVALLEHTFGLHHSNGPKSPHIGQLIGEGFHFQVWRYPAAPLALAVGIPKRNFLEEEQGFRQQLWLRAMKQLKHSEGHLVPPFEILKSIDDQSWILITPYGERDANCALPEWQPLDHHIQQTQAALKQQGLKIDDYIQIRCCQGTPFICDFSDLRSVR